MLLPWPLLLPLVLLAVGSTGSATTVVATAVATAWRCRCLADEIIDDDDHHVDDDDDDYGVVWHMCFLTDDHDN